MTNTPRITVAYGDGIGPEIMEATLQVLKAAGAKLEYDIIEVGEKVYQTGNLSGITDEAWETLQRNGIFLKSPITTPQGGGYKSLNVTIRKTLGLYSNVRPTRAYAPYVKTWFPDMDVVIIRENEEDLYAGIEYQQTSEVVHSIKLITRVGCEKIVRYAFEYARANSRRHVTCMTKDNIMKHTDGLFHQVFNEIATEYPEIKTDHYIIDIGSARLADDPGRFDVIVTMNLYGDIISDIAAEVAGSVGLCGSANIGDNFAMFEAIHGSAPDISGLNLANPSGLINAACMMLVHLGQGEVSARIQNALLCTLEDGIHTGDVYREGHSAAKAGTKEFAAALIERLGREPKRFSTVRISTDKPIHLKPVERRKSVMQRVGVDVYVHHDGDPTSLGQALEQAAAGILNLKMMSNRGLIVYPERVVEGQLTDQYRCRFCASADYTVPVSQDAAMQLLMAIHGAGLEINKTEFLYTDNGKRAFSLGQGER